MRPELASKGAAPAWRASWASLWKRPIGPISASSLAAVMAPQPGSSSSAGAVSAVRCSSSRSELDDRAGELAAAHDQLARDPYLHLCRPAGQPAADTIKLHRSVERLRGDDQCWVELMQVPAQPLLDPSPLVDEIVAVVDQQLQLPKGLLVRARAAQPRLPQGGSGDGERVDRVRLAALPAGATLGRHQLRRHPHELLVRRAQLALERSGQLPAVLERPQPLAVKPGAHSSRSLLAAATVVSASIRPASSTATAVSECLWTSTPITIIQIASSNRWGRPASGQTSIEAAATLLSGHARRSREGGGDTTLASQPHTATRGNGVSRRQPESENHAGHHHHRASVTLSSGMTPEGLSRRESSTR